MSYICLDCGHIFDEGEQISFQEAMGERFGEKVYRKISGCPICGGEYEETKPCAICGSEQLEEDLNGGICDECIDKYKHDIDMCYKVGKYDDDKVEINCFLAAMFDKKEIEEILFNRVKKRAEYIREYIEADCEKFINSDRSWFGERLLEEIEKEKK
jgi:hypothetical protein